jgi:hypothetical protein
MTEIDLHKDIRVAVSKVKMLTAFAGKPLPKKRCPFVLSADL